MDAGHAEDAGAIHAAGGVEHSSHILAWRDKLCGERSPIPG